MKPSDILCRVHEGALRAGESGAVSGVVVPWGIVDSYDTSFARGAFGGEQTIPIVWNHNSEQIPVGQARAFDTDEGRAFEGQLFVDELPEARAVARLLASGAVRDCSHAFVSLVPLSPERVFTQCRMLEISPVLMGSNPAAYIQGRASVATLAYALDNLARVKDLLDSAKSVAQYGEGATPELQAAVESELDVLRKYLKGFSLFDKG